MSESIDGWERAVCLVSGGQDSTTCLYWAKKTFKDVTALNFDYRQRHKVEMECAKKIAYDAGVKLVTLPVEALRVLGGAALTDEIEVKSGLNERNLPNTFVPGRNILFLTLAAAYAYQHGFRNLVTGVCQTDYSGYPDCREETMKALQQTLQYGMDYALQIYTPLMFLTKKETVELAYKLGCLEKVVEDTHTCYNGVHAELHWWGYGCGECPACQIRAKGFEEAPTFIKERLQRVVSRETRGNL